MKLIKKTVMIIFVLCFLLSPNSAFAYGGGGGGGGSDSEEFSSGGGAVSWSKNPNGLDVMGSSIWHGRPENLRKGPYQPGTAVEDAEQDLLDGFKNKEYTKEEVKENLLWAKKAGIHISNEAQQVLDGLSATTGSSEGKSQQNKKYVYPIIDYSLYSHTFYTGDPLPDATAFALVTLAYASTKGKFSSKEALATLIIMALATRGVIY
jgi:hypothetical protein